MTTELTPHDDPIVHLAVLAFRRQILLEELDDVAAELATIVAELLDTDVDAATIARTMGLLS